MSVRAAIALMPALLAGCLLLAQPVPSCDLAACFPYGCDDYYRSQCEDYCDGPSSCADGYVCDYGDCVIPCNEAYCGGYACDDLYIDQCEDYCTNDNDCADGYECCDGYPDDCDYGDCVR